jgi:hypothetical protein
MAVLAGLGRNQCLAQLVTVGWMSKKADSPQSFRDLLCAGLDILFRGVLPNCQPARPVDSDWTERLTQGSPLVVSIALR